MPRNSVPAAGWYVEVTLPGGRVVRPDVVGDPSRNPAANDFPTLSIPVRDRDLWRSLDLTKDIGMDVWKDGRPQPVDTLEDVSGGEGATVDLVGRGGTALDARDKRSVDFRPTHLVAEDIITANTPYTANVDTPVTTVDQNVTVESADTQAEWGDAQTDDPSTIPDETNDDLSIGDGEGLRLSKTAYVSEAESESLFDGATTVSDSAASDGATVELDASDEVIDFNFAGHEYLIPDDQLRLAVRYRVPDDPDNDGDYEFPDIDIVYEAADGDVTIGGWADDAIATDDSYSWRTFDVPPDAIDGDDVLFPSFEILCSGNPQNGRFLCDVVAILDARYHGSSGFDNTVDSNGYLSSPTEYPIGATKNNYPVSEFKSIVPVDATVGGRVEVTANDTSALEEIALSNDRGGTWATSAADVTTFETDFANAGPSLRMRLKLSGLNTTRSTATPTQGFKRPELDAFTLKADLEDLPLVVNWSGDGAAMSNLQEISQEFADGIFEVRAQASGSLSVEWTEAGVRTTDRQDPITQYQATTTVEPTVERVVVKGSARQADNETWTADIGNWVALNEDAILLGRTTVTNQTGTETYIEGSDYLIDGPDGRIKATSGGDLTDGTDYEIDYSFRPSGSATVDNPPATPEVKVATIPAVTSEDGAAQVARRILSQVDSPLQKAAVTVPNDRVGWTIVDAVDFDVLPDGFADLEVRDIENTPDQTVFRLGSRESVAEIISRIQTRLDSVSRRA